MEKRFGQADQPAYREQKSNPHEHRQSETDLSGFPLILLGEFVCQDGNKDDIIDAEDDLEDSKGEQ